MRHNVRPWKIGQRSSLQVPLDQLVQDPETGLWDRRDWVDPPIRRHKAVGPDTMSIEPHIPGDPLPTWTKAVGDVTLTGSSTGYAGYALRQRFAAGTAAGSGTLIRVHILAPSAVSVRITGIYIGHGATSGDAYDFESAPKPLTVGLTPAFTLIAGATQITDSALFDLDTTKPLVVAVDVSSDTVSSNTGLSTAYTLYSKAAARESYITNVTGYSSTAGACALVKRVEVI